MTFLGQVIWKRWVSVFGALSVVAAIAATQLTIRSGSLTFATWLGLFFVQLIIWNIWGLLTPLIFRLSSYISWHESKIKFILIHIPFSIITVLVFLVSYASIYVALNGGGFDSIFPTFVGLLISSFHWFLILYWITVGFEYYLRVAESYKAQEIVNVQLEGQLTEAQLRALKMQLNPHFLFNALNAISGLIRSGENSKSIGMVAKLSDFLREVLVEKGSQLNRLSDELTFLEKYLEVEKLRFADKLEVVMEIGEGTKECLIPSLIMQPLIENAIKHGISKKQEARLLVISSAKVEEQLRVEVYNEGPPVSGVMQRQGVGISNTLDRLAQLYNDQYTFEMTDEEDGVKVTMVIPFDVSKP